MQPVIKAFIFDIGNVLLHFDFQIALRRIEPHCAEPIVPQVLEPIKDLYEDGQMTRQEFQEQVKKAIGFSGTDEQLVSAWEDIFEENLVMTDLVLQLEKHYPLYLLSNTSDLHIEYVYREFPVFRVFSDAVYSYKVGCSKPSVRIYKIAAEKFGIEPCETIFIDDLGVNVEGARAAGFHAIQYDFTRHERLIGELEHLGVKI
jgi:HAD superfamily hydrolase (TIGR01549 family)